MKIMRALIAGIVVVGVASAGQRASAQSPRIDIANAIAWLPSNTETLIVARGPIDLGETADALSDLSGHLARSVAGGPLGDAKGDVFRLLSGAHIRFAVEGARAFRAPRGLGLGPYEGCHILAFENVDGPVIDRFMSALETAGAAATRVAGVDAMLVKWRAEDDEWSAFVVRARPDVIVIATSERMLSDVLERAQRGGAGRAFPRSLQEWAGVDTSASVWAIRHYLREGSRSDPTSPLTSEQRPANEPDTLAVGMAVSVGGRPGKFVAHYYSTNSQAQAIARRLWSHPREGLTPLFASGPKGDVRISGAPRSADGRSMLALVLLAALGHAIYI